MCFVCGCERERASERELRLRVALARGVMRVSKMSPCFASCASASASEREREVRV
jgi:hypothetical protein